MTPSTHNNPQSPEDALRPTNGGREVSQYGSALCRALEGVLRDIDTELTRRALTGEPGLIELARERGRLVRAGRVDG